MLKDLQTQHRNVARLKFAGLRPTEISTKTGLAISTVRSILSDPLCKAYIEKLDNLAEEEIVSVRKRMIKLNNKALDRIEDILDANSAKVPWAVILNAAKDNLDRTGYQVVQKSQYMHAHLTKDDINELKQRAVEAGACITEAEYSEVVND